MDVYFLIYMLTQFVLFFCILRTYCRFPFGKVLLLLPQYKFIKCVVYIEVFTSCMDVGDRLNGPCN